MGSASRQEHSGGASEPRTSRRLVVDDIRTFRAFLTTEERRGTFEALHQPSPRHAARDLVETWTLIFAAWALCFYVSPLWTPLALIVIGSRQRALGNRLHDASHGNMLRGKKANQWVASLLCALPIFEDYELYRLEHLQHHAYLGTPGRDPDFLELPAQGEESPRSAWRVYFSFALNPRMWRDSVLTTLPRVGAVQRLRVLAWWTVMLGVLALLAGPRGALVFAALWLASKATVYHLIKVFAEISDHVGLVPGTILGYTRNLPNNWLSFFLHPHHDNYHLTHHLFPRIPLAHLPRMHGLLMEVGLYAQAHQCERYFLGESSVVHSWLQPKPGPMAAVPVVS
jgi:fatty acid desaturase